MNGKAWVEDIAKAEVQARTLPRSPAASPHWLRCEFFNEQGQRCRKGYGHGEDHEAVKTVSIDRDA